MKSKYNKIDVLSEIEHIRTRPGVYVGSTENPTHLLEEVLDNALDEALEGYATEIRVKTDRQSFSVYDNGRGIPQGFNAKYGMYSPVLIAYKLFSGSKFAGNTAYKISAGLHGIGLVAVNALSDRLLISTTRDNSKFFVEFCHAIPKEPQITKAISNTQGTFIEVIPTIKKHDTLYGFDQGEVDKERIETRLRLASSFVKGLKIFFNEEEIKPLSQIELLGGSSSIEPQSLITAKHFIKDSSEFMEILLGYDLRETDFKGLGSINLLSVNKGSHIRAAQEAIMRAWDSIFDKDTREYLTKKDVLCGCRVFVKMALKDPQYSSQSKNELTGRYDEVRLRSMLEGIAKQIKKSLGSKDIERLVRTLEAKFRDHRSHLNSQNSSKFIDETIILGNEDKQRRSAMTDSKLVDCSSSTREDTELFIAEGDSAGGNLITERNPEIHAILPLRGKPQNSIERSVESILGNREMRSLINSLGCGLLHKEDPSKIRYSKIIIATDADVDGLNIRALILGAFCYLTPKTIASGRIYIAESPLYGQYTKNGKFIPIFKLEEAKPNLPLLRFKGLGSMDGNELYTSIVNKKTRRLIQVGNEDIGEACQVVGKTSEKRRLLLEANILYPQVRSDIDTL